VTPSPELGLGAPPPPAPRQKHIYEKDWFWGGLAAVLIIGAIVGTIALGASGDPAMPKTTLGDMRAF
jgi:hypothetical protein